MTVKRLCGDLILGAELYAVKIVASFYKVHSGLVYERMEQDVAGCIYACFKFSAGDMFLPRIGKIG